MGCDTIGFRYRYDDFDNVTELPSGKTVHATKWYRYPSAIAGHRTLDTLHAVPTLIRTVYQQTLTAIAGEALILAGIGLRATIEAVCNHLKVAGANLEKRIDALAKSGYISNSDKRRLHAIRFLGNDAAHDIREPKSSDVRVALEIIEHLMKAVFILEFKAKNLDMTVETFDHFKELLIHCAGSVKGDQPLSMTAILGPAKRRVDADMNAFEVQLVAEINGGTFKELKLASVENVEGKDVQLYQVDRDAMDDDIPF
jgi:hypothetical protein